MHVATTFWNDQVFTFDRLFHVKTKSRDVRFQADLNSPSNTVKFFKDVAKFVASKECHDTMYTENRFQFAVPGRPEINDNTIIPVCWFDLIISDELKISHDIAFNTTLLEKNNMPVPLGKFRLHTSHKLPRYREFNLKSRAYKFMANQVRTLL